MKGIILVLFLDEDIEVVTLRFVVGYLITRQILHYHPNEDLSDGP